MYRKRNVPAPGFRLPTPHNPMTGGRAPMALGTGLIIGKTDASGITAMSGAEAGEGAVVLQNRHRGDATILDTNEERHVYSLAGSEVDGDTYVGMVEDRYGELWVVQIFGGGSKLWLFTLNEDMGATTAGEAAADKIDIDGTDTTEDFTVEDPHGIFSGLSDTAAGMCVEQYDTSGTKHYIIIQAECPA